MLYFLNLLELLIPDLDEWIEVIGILILFCGIAEAFFGYKLFNLLLGIIGFSIGATVGVMLFLQSGNIYNNSDAIRIYILIGGIIGAALAETFHKLGVFLTVGAMGMFIIFLITQNEQISLVLGIICGIAGVIIEKYIIIVTTALSGGKLAAMGIWFIGLANGENKRVQLLGWIIGICGMVFQLWIEKVKPIGVMADGGSAGIGKETENIGIKSKAESVKDALQLRRQRKILFCRMCGSQLLENASFCQSCGEKVHREEG